MNVHQMIHAYKRSKNWVKSISLLKDVVISLVPNKPEVSFDDESPQDRFLILVRMAIRSIFKRVIGFVWEHHIIDETR